MRDGGKGHRNKAITFQPAQQVCLATPLYGIAVAYGSGSSENAEISGRVLVMGNFMCQTD